MKGGSLFQLVGLRQVWSSQKVVSVMLQTVVDMVQKVGGNWTQPITRVRGIVTSCSSSLHFGIRTANWRHCKELKIVQQNLPLTSNFMVQTRPNFGLE